MDTRGPIAGGLATDVEADARITPGAVPVTPVAVELEQQARYLVGCGFDFLQADDIRALARDPVLDLRVTSPDAVDVPGRYLQKRAWAAWRSAAGIAMMSAWSATCFLAMASAFAIVSGSEFR